MAGKVKVKTILPQRSQRDTEERQKQSQGRGGAEESKFKVKGYFDGINRMKV